jgi:photosystem II stability/assembly factor-like uncharacterized protein
MNGDSTELPADPPERAHAQRGSRRARVVVAILSTCVLCAGAWVAKPWRSARSPASRSEQVRGDLLSVAFAGDGLSGWSVGTRETILSTEDGGETWSVERSRATGSLPDTLYYVSTHSEGGGVSAFGGTHSHYRTQTRKWFTAGPLFTAGRSHALLRVAGPNLRGAAAKSVRSGADAWGVGPEGSAFLFYEEMYVAEKSTGVTDNLWGVTASHDGEHCWAVGDAGAIVATRDLGRTWTKYASGATTRLLDVTFLKDDRRGWVVGEAGTILTTSDGGVTWTPQKSGTSRGLLRIRFLEDGKRGWAVGDDGTILHTSNGGIGWHAQRSGVASNLTDVLFMKDGTRGWAVGTAATILTTRDGGESWRAASVSAELPEA